MQGGPGPPHCRLSDSAVHQDGDKYSLCSPGEARPWVCLIRHLQLQYLVVKVEEVGVLFTDVCLGIRYQLTNVPVDKQEGQK